MSAVKQGTVIFALCLAGVASYFAFDEPMKIRNVDSSSSSGESPQSVLWPDSAHADAAAAATRIASTSARYSEADVQPGQAPSFETAKDLFAFALQAAGSNDPVLLAQGFQAAALCIATKADWDFITPALQTAATVPDADPRHTSALALRARCEGFLNGDAAANNAVRSRLRQQAALDPLVYLASSASPPISREQFDQALRSRDWATASAAASDIVPRILRAQKIDEGSPDAVLLGFAYLAALCEIGRDCSSDSATYHFECARFGQCSGSLRAQYSKQIPAADVPRFEALVRRCAAAWQARDIAFFGYAP